MLTTDKALYILFVNHQNPENIQTSKGMHDDVEGDVVSISLDTFGDRRTAYRFSVSATGARMDCRLLDDGRNRDYSWDGVWFSAARIMPWGYVVEIEIPYRSIRYDRNLDCWGVDFERWIAYIPESLAWGRFEEAEGRRVSKFRTACFDAFKPEVRSLNLEIYPVGMVQAEYEGDGRYDLRPTAGIDIFYNPSQQLTFQLTGNPDFAQIEADPYTFNISRYETYYAERRPFFTEGSEVFMPAGKERNSGFYSPLELFYSRRIGRRLPGGKDVPIHVGTKAFGRKGAYEYGGFLAVTGEEVYESGDEERVEERAVFGSARITRQILNNLSIGFLYVGKHTETMNNGVIDIDGAFRSSNAQLSFQLARSFRNDEGDFAGSMGMLMIRDKSILGMSGRYIGKDFDVDGVGFVPWKGTGQLILLAGPRWYFPSGAISQIILYGGGFLNYERVDGYTDHMAALGLNMQFRSNWGYEFTLIGGRARDLDVDYNQVQISLGSWINVSPRWTAHINTGYFKTYNFRRDFPGYYSRFSGSVAWQAMDFLRLGTSMNLFAEEDPNHRIEEITFNARPHFTLTPVNNMNVRVYVDHLGLRSTGKLEQVIGGFLFSWNFRPKSWVYFAVNEMMDRSDAFGGEGELLPERLHTRERACVLKLKYLVYF
ncbi:MAG TPA: hydrolase [bacterium]|nr:hydrolase [bacterium]